MPLTFGGIYQEEEEIHLQREAMEEEIKDEKKEEEEVEESKEEGGTEGERIGREYLLMQTE